MSPTREELCSFIDGELAPFEMAKVAEMIERSPELQRYVEDQEHLRQRLHTAFSTLMEAPIPERLLESARNAPVSFRARINEWLNRRAGTSAGSVVRFAVPTTAMVLGLFIGIGVERQSAGSSDLVATPAAGQVMAQAQLARALDTQLASEPASGGAPSIGVSFRSKSGQDCRTFEVAGATASTDGVACRHNGTWMVGALVTTAHAPNSAYQLAGSEMPGAIRDTVAETIAGEPFDAAAERRARDSGWK
jgi:hypothetical protein